ncbi:MAG: ATP-binding protein [Bacteroidales bacterium]
MESIIFENSEKNLLVIDDEVEITKALVRQFRKIYNVYTANNAHEALVLMEKVNIQVILSDQRMPGMTGVDFYSGIRDKYPDALKLILTGYSDIEAVIRAINEGQVFRYVKKPWNPDEMESVIKEAFEKYELIISNRKLMDHLKEANQNLEEKVKMRTQDLEIVNNRLSELNIEKNRYIGMVAHDLRNPIGIAVSFSELLINEYDEIPKESQIDYLGNINESCSYSLNLINDFLDVSKIEAEIFDLKLTELNYISLVEKGIAQNKILAKNKSQEIALLSEKEEILIRCDKNKMLQVIDNLLSNAIKYSGSNKRIIIDVSGTDKEITTRITDQGQGIPSEELPELFKAFKTTSIKSTGSEKSTGLGLAIVKKIIQAHNGKLSVESKVGEGSVFSFTLPVL